MHGGLPIKCLKKSLLEGYLEESPEGYLEEFPNKSLEKAFKKSKKSSWIFLEESSSEKESNLLRN